MPAVKIYPRPYINKCRAIIADQLAAFRELKAHAKSGEMWHFEPVFFDDLVIILDAMFANRAQSMEGTKDNPMNEVRLLAESLLLNDGILGVSTIIKQDASKSVLGVRTGEVVKVREADFERLAEAYFSAIDATFGEG